MHKIGLSITLLGTILLSACGTTPSSKDVSITLDEWHMQPNTTKVASGEVNITVSNHGMIDHEVVFLKTTKSPRGLVTVDGKVNEEAVGENVGEVEVKTGETTAVTFNLAPGHYILICNIPSHYAAGMFGELTVSS